MRKLQPFTLLSALTCLLLCLQYEPELFPGLIYRMLVPKVVLLIFVSGKVVLTGKQALGFLASAVDIMWSGAFAACVLMKMLCLPDSCWFLRLVCL